MSQPWLSNRFLERAWDRLTKRLWRPDLDQSPRLVRAAIRWLRITVVALSESISIRARHRAASLTLVTVLSVAPLLASSLALGKGLGYSGVRTAILRVFHLTDADVHDNPTAQHLRQQFDTILNYVESADLTALGVVGLVSLFVSALWALARVENCFNEVWSIERGRPLARRLADYTSVLVICSLLFVVATAVTASLSSLSAVHAVASLIRPALAGAGEEFAQVTASGIVYAVGLLGGFALLMAAFTCLFVFVPNIRVRWRSGLIAGAVTAILWQLAQWGYLKSQLGLARYSAIYATFASFPIFLLWVYMGWQIVLFGAELSFVHQSECEGINGMVEELSVSQTVEAALRIMLAVGRSYVEGQPALSVQQLSKQIGLAPRVVGRIVNGLVTRGLLIEVAVGERSFVPGRSLDSITLQDVVDVFWEADNQPNLCGAYDDSVARFARHALEDARLASETILGRLSLRQAVDLLEKEDRVGEAQAASG